MKARQGMTKEDEKWCAALRFPNRLSIHSLNWGTVYIFHNLDVEGEGEGVKT